MSTLELDTARFRVEMPAQVAAHCDPNRPPAQRLVAARGMLPLATQDQLAVLVALVDDPESAVATAAVFTLKEMPANLIKPVLTNPATPGWLLEGLGVRLRDRQVLLADLLSHRATPDRIHLWAAANTSSAAVHERLCVDLERLKRTPKIIEQLWENEAVDRYLLRPPVEFLVREGVVLESVPLFKEVLQSLSFNELKDAVADIELPAELDGLIDPRDEAEEEGTEVEKTDLHKAVADKDAEAGDSTAFRHPPHAIDPVAPFLRGRSALFQRIPTAVE